MTTLNVLTREGQVIVVEGQDGLSLMEVLKSGGVDEIVALCGGSCSCATCHVYIDAADKVLTPMSADEDDLLDSSDHRKNSSRLSCQIKLTGDLDGMSVTVAPED